MTDSKEDSKTVRVLTNSKEDLKKSVPLLNQASFSLLSSFQVIEDRKCAVLSLEERYYLIIERALLDPKIPLFVDIKHIILQFFMAECFLSKFTFQLCTLDREEITKIMRGEEYFYARALPRYLDHDVVFGFMNCRMACDYFPIKNRKEYHEIMNILDDDVFSCIKTIDTVYQAVWQDTDLDTLEKAYTFLLEKNIDMPICISILRDMSVCDLDELEASKCAGNLLDYILSDEKKDKQKDDF